MDENYMEFELTKSDTSMANALRRVRPARPRSGAARCCPRRCCPLRLTAVRRRGLRTDDHRGGADDGDRSGTRRRGPAPRDRRPRPPGRLTRPPRAPQVFVHDNSSVLFDEFLAHRLGCATAATARAARVPAALTAGCVRAPA